MVAISPNICSTQDKKVSESLEILRLIRHFFIIFSVPKVLTHCAEFIEKRGIIDGIYRLSGIASNIQKLRVAFDEDRVPNLYDDRGVLQDIHSVSSLLKMYFRELPNPICTSPMSCVD